MKKTDKITVEITLAELAKTYAIMGRVNGRTSSDIYWKGKALLDVTGEILADVLEQVPCGKTLDFNSYEDELFRKLFKEKTQAQLKLEELEQTIKDAQQQIAQLKEMK